MKEGQAVHAEKELDKFTLSITREDKRALSPMPRARIRRWLKSCANGLTRSARGRSDVSDGASSRSEPC